jgi:hypothetical protein
MIRTEVVQRDLDTHSVQPRDGRRGIGQVDHGHRLGDLQN